MAFGLLDLIVFVLFVVSVINRVFIDRSQYFNRTICRHERQCGQPCGHCHCQL
jgi:hypothetical protein